MMCDLYAYAAGKRGEGHFEPDLTSWGPGEAEK